MTVTGRDLLLHLGYLNDLFHVRWINVAYWTLAIELQWYLLVGLTFPLLAAPTRFSFYRGGRHDGAVLRISLQQPAHLPSPAGISDRRLSLPVPLAHIGMGEMLGLIAAVILAIQRPLGWMVVVVAAATAMLIALSHFHSDGMDRVGDVSYSLYLIHLPIGVGVIGVLSHWLPYSSRYIGILDVIGVAASAWAAWILYQIIAKPSQEMSSAIKFTHRQKQQAAQPAVAVAGGD